MSKIMINNVSLELDLMDADVMEMYQDALKDTVAESGKLSEQIKEQTIASHESMRKQCRIVDEFVDKLFGEGTAGKILPRKNHLGDHLEAFAVICRQADEMKRQTNELIADNRYSPDRLNREQRRNQQKKNRPSNFRSVK